MSYSYKFSYHPRSGAAVSANDAQTIYRSLIDMLCQEIEASFQTFVVEGGLDSTSCVSEAYERLHRASLIRKPLM